MKKKLFLVALILLLLSSFLYGDDIKALVIFPYLYGANSFLFIEKVQEMGWEITTTGLTSTVQPCFWGEALSVDILIPSVTIADYDCLILCPAQSYANPSAAYSAILNSSEAIDLFIDAQC